jgi:hypothetical protein
MAEDLRRHMRNEPIVARRPSAAYRAKKFFQRNRILVLGTLAIILALTAGVVTTGVQAYRARQAEKLALDQKERANAAQKQALEQSPSRNGSGTARWNRRVWLSGKGTRR